MREMSGYAVGIEFERSIVDDGANTISDHHKRWPSVMLEPAHIGAKAIVAIVERYGADEINIVVNGAGDESALVRADLMSIDS